MRWLLIASALLTVAAAPTPTPQPSQTVMNARVFDSVWTLVARNYWDPKLRGVDWRAALATYRPQAIAAQDNRTLYEVIGRMLDQIGDSHVYVDNPMPASAASGDDASVGIVSVLEDGAWRVLSVDANSPAGKAGVMEGWQLLTVDGRVPERDDSPPIAGQIQKLALLDGMGFRHDLTLQAERLAPYQPVAARRLPGNVL
jgi:carboxyl-terminal processing protease